MYFEGDTVTLSTEAYGRTATHALHILVASAEPSNGDTPLTPNSDNQFKITLGVGLNRIVLQERELVGGTTEITTLTTYNINAAPLRDAVLKHLQATLTKVMEEIEDVETSKQKGFTDSSGMAEQDMHLTELSIERDNLQVRIEARKRILAGRPIITL